MSSNFHVPYQTDYCNFCCREFNVLHEKSQRNDSCYLLFPDIFSWHCIKRVSKEHIISSLYLTITNSISKGRNFLPPQTTIKHQISAPKFSAFNWQISSMVKPSKMWIFRLSLCIIRNMHLIKPQLACLVILSHSSGKIDEKHIIFIQQISIY